jgi:hypothetical protein
MSNLARVLGDVSLVDRIIDRSILFDAIRRICVPCKIQPPHQSSASTPGCLSSQFQGVGSKGIVKRKRLRLRHTRLANATPFQFVVA